MSRISSPRSPASCRTAYAVRAAARVLPGRHGLGRTESARDADHRRARGLPARHLRGRGRVLPAGERALDTCIAIRTLWLRDGVAHLQAGGGIVADSDPAAEHEECLAQAAALWRRRSTWQSRSSRDPPRSTTTTRSRTTSRTCSASSARRSSCGGTTRSTRRRGRAARAVAPRRLARPRPPGAMRARRARSVERLLPTTPMLGVCLGHQAIVEVFGGEVGYARELVHGKASPVRHGGAGLFDGLPDPFAAGPLPLARGDSRCPTASSVSAIADDGEVMAVRHRELPAGRRPVPSRVGADARRARARAQLPRGRELRRSRRRCARLSRRPRPLARARRAR